MHLMQGHPALSTPSLSCTHPTLLPLLKSSSPYVTHHLTSSFSHSPASGVSSTDATQWATQHCEICCVRLAQLVWWYFSLSVENFSGGITLGWVSYWDRFFFLGFCFRCMQGFKPWSNISLTNIDSSGAALLRIPTFILRALHFFQQPQKAESSFTPFQHYLCKWDRCFRHLKTTL